MPAPTLSILLTLLLCSSLLNGQLSLFTGSSFEHEVTPRWGYQFEIEHRQLLNTGRENRVLILGVINRVITKGINVTPGVRLTPDYGPGETTLRLFTDLNGALPLGRSRWALEGRLRSQYERIYTEAGSSPEVAVRPRVGVAFTAHANTTLVSEYETRYRFDTRDEIVEHRFTLAVEQKLSTRIGVDLFVRLEREVNQPQPTTQPYVGLYLLYVLPDERHRDWRYRSPFGRSLLW